MSNQLAELRGTFRDALTGAGLHAFTAAPDHATPPMAFVGPGDPYLTREGANFGGEMIVRHEVTVVAAAGVIEKAAEDLEDLILTAFRATEALATVERVERPGQISINGQTYLACVIELVSCVIRTDQ